MSGYYDDNFGAWECAPDDDPEEIARFYEETQRRSVRKRCVGCQRMVRIMPQYDVCDACAQVREHGGDF